MYMYLWNSTPHHDIYPQTIINIYICIYIYVHIYVYIYKYIYKYHMRRLRILVFALFPYTPISMFILMYIHKSVLINYTYNCIYIPLDTPLEKNFSFVEFSICIHRFTSIHIYIHIIFVYTYRRIRPPWSS
jgi:hypothetical protein